MTTQTTRRAIHTYLKQNELPKKLKELITQTPNPTEHGKEEGLVICLNGGFGTGKTWTLKKLQEKLAKDNHPVAYLSAWESDHAGDAVVAIISQLDELILKETKSWLQKNKQSSVLDKLKESSGRVARAVLKSLPAALEEIPGGKLLSETINNYLDVADSAKKPQKHDAIEQFELRSKALTQSKAALTTLAGNEFFASDGKRLVILIDELDRCRPTYAIEMLEAIKHWFCVPNVVFVLAMDREQLSHSIRAVYGQGFDVDGYFLRFFHRLEQMPTLTKNNTSYFFTKLGHTYSNKHIISERLLEEIDFLSLRECERVYCEWQDKTESLYQREQTKTSGFYQFDENQLQKCNFLLLLYLSLKIRISEHYADIFIWFLCQGSKKIMPLEQSSRVEKSFSAYPFLSSIYPQEAFFDPYRSSEDCIFDTMFWFNDPSKILLYTTDMGLHTEMIQNPESVGYLDEVVIPKIRAHQVSQGWANMSEWVFQDPKLTRLVEGLIPSKETLDELNEKTAAHYRAIGRNLRHEQHT